MDLSNVVRDLRSERERLAGELAQVDRALSVLGGASPGRARTRSKPQAKAARRASPRRLSRAGREAIAAAARKRWAAWRKANK